jgi:outer membrane murein-binding lipoprotein Lpp
MKRTKIALAAAVMSSATILSGCTTILDETSSAIAKTVGPRAAQLDDGSYQLPQFAEADNGTVFSTESPRAAVTSLQQIMEPLPEQERLYFSRVLISLGYYHGCKDRGERSYMKNPFRSNYIKSCNMVTFYGDSLPRAKTLLELGRPDSFVIRTKQDKMLVSGAPVGEPYQVGYSSGEAWSKWINWSGNKLNGKTRSELLQEFLQYSKGMHGKNAR